MKFTQCKCGGEDEVNRLSVEHVPFRLDDVLEAVSLTIGHQAQDTALGVVCCVSRGVPCNLRGDVLWLKKILASMFIHAMYLTCQGKVVMNITRSAADGKRVKLQFSISGAGDEMMVAHEYRLSRPNSLESIRAHGFVSAYGFDGDHEVDGYEYANHVIGDSGIVVSTLLAELMGGALLFEAGHGDKGVFHFIAWFELDDAREKLVVAPGVHVLVAGNGCDVRHSDISFIDKRAEKSGVGPMTTNLLNRCNTKSN